MSKYHTYVAGRMGSERVGELVKIMADASWAVFDWRDVECEKPYLDNQINEGASLLMDWGVRNSIRFILVVEDNIYGALVELGIAIGSNGVEHKDITIALTGDDRQSVLFAHPEVTVMHYDDLVEQVKAEVEEGKKWDL